MTLAGLSGFNVFKPNTHADADARRRVYTEFATSWRQSRRVGTGYKFASSEVELCRVGGVNAPVGSRDPVVI